jgi:hypothetical protein
MIAELEKVWKEMVAADGDTIPAFFLRGWWKPIKSSVKIADVTVEIRNENLPNTSSEL